MNDRTNQFAYGQVDRYRNRAIKALERVEGVVGHALQGLRERGQDVGFTAEIAASARAAVEAVAAMEAAQMVLEIVKAGDE